jgi:GNAT superfamily N-acetyltransferase
LTDLSRLTLDTWPCHDKTVILYSTDVSDLAERDLHGFFVGWPSPPTPGQHLAVLRGSYRVVIARDAASHRVVGFVNMISDGVLTAFIPWLEVLPEYQGKGIGSELMRRVLAAAEHLYSVDLTCDDALSAYYQRLGMQAITGMAIRRWQAVERASHAANDESSAQVQSRVGPQLKSLSHVHEHTGVDPVGLIRRWTR